MAKRRLRAASLAVVVLAALALATLAAPAGGAPSIGAAPGRLDLGDLARGDEATFDVVVRNGGDAVTDVTFGVQQTEGATADVVPAAATLAPGQSVTVRSTLRLPADAAPGRHQPAFVAAMVLPASGNAATGAVLVPVLYNVPAVDAAAAAIVSGSVLHLRIVNGHGAARDVGLEVRTSTGAATVEAFVLPPRTLAGGASWLSDSSFDAARYADGAYTLRVNGTATGGTAPEPYEATYPLYVAAGVFSLQAPAPAASGGDCVAGVPCGSGQPPSGPAAPVPSGPPLVPVVPLPDPAGSAEAPSGGSGAEASADQGNVPHPAAGPSPSRSALAAALFAAAAAVLLSLGRRGLGP